MRLVEAQPPAHRISAQRAGAPSVFRLHLEAPPDSFTRAFLSYELDGLADWTAALRSLNGLPAQGGFGAVAVSTSSLQLEEINPRWLRPGVNEVAFFPVAASDAPPRGVSSLFEGKALLPPAGATIPYAVRNLRLVLVDEGPQPSLRITHPTRGEATDDGALVTGFVDPALTAEGPAELFVDGVHVPGGIRPGDGAFAVFAPSRARAGEPWEVEVEIVYPDGTSVSQAAQIAAPSREPADEGEVEAQPGKAKSLSLGRARLDVPPGAVDKKVKLTVRALASAELPAMDAGMTNVTPKRGGFRMGPHGQRFKQSLELTLPYDPALIPEGMTEDEIETFYFDEAAGRWIPLPRVKADSGEHVVVSLTDHFTDFINATLAMPDEPSGASLSPNSLQELAQADPATEITLIAPPEGGPTGDAMLDFPLRVPPGRRGMEPSLALHYNSGRANGWLGLGWDLTLSSIEISTLFGVPRYDGTERYFFDGEQLVSSGEPGRFLRRSEGSFDRIVRHGSGPRDFWWEVTDKNGTRSVYGQTAQARLQDPQGGNVFRWYLEREIDLHGNTVDYAYFQDSGGSGGEPWVQIYPQTIRYTGGPGLAPHYRVDFLLDGGERVDKESSGRSGFKVVTRRRLVGVDVSAGEELVRRYLLLYREGDFRKSLLAAVAMLGEDGVSELYRHTFDYEAAAESFAPQASWNGVRAAEDLTDEVRGGAGAHVFAGLGPPGCQPHVGVQVGGSVTDSTQQVTFLDLNGDGLPDRIDEDGNVDLNRRGAFSNQSMDGTGTLGHTLEWTFDLAVGAHFELGVSGSVNASWVWSHANDDHATLDVNGDGLPDLVSTSGGFTTRINDGSSFQQQSTWTGFGGSDLSVDGEEEEVLSAFKLSDALRKLELPYAGTIALDGAVQKKQAGGDGATVAIFHNGARIWRRTLAANDTAPCVPAPGDACGSGLSLSVQAGDRLYFLAGSVRDTTADALLWAPRATYEGQDTEAREPYGARVFQFDAGEDFRLAGFGGSAWTAPSAGTARIEGALVKQATCDDVTVAVVKAPMNPLLPAETVYSRVLAAGEEGSFDEIPPIAVAAGDTLFLRVASQTPVDPARVDWTPQVSFGDRQDPAAVAFEVPRFQRSDPTEIWTAPSDGEHTFHVSWTGSSPAVLFVQGLHRLIERRELPAGGANFTVTAQADAGEPLYFTVVGVAGGLSVNGGVVPVNFRLRDDEQDVLSGGWHGWFYGEWNGGSGFDEGALVPPENENDNAPDYVPAVPRWQGAKDFAEPAWVAGGFDLYLAAEGVKPSRQGGNAAGDLDASSGASGGGGLGILRKTYGRTSALSAELIAGLAVSGGFSETQLDLLDMNGDLYPDQVSENGVRFSNGTSGFGALAGFGGLDEAVRRGEDGTVTLSLGGTGISYSKKSGKGKPKSVQTTLPSVGSTVSLSQTRYDLMDVNGDGLPDRVSMGSGDGEVQVRLNLGYRFGQPERWPLPGWGGQGPGSCQDVVDYATSEVAGLVSDVDSPDALAYTRSSALNAGVAFGPFGGGASTTLARTLVELADVNGDGLLDQVGKEQDEGFFRVKLNRGDGWEPERRWPVPAWETSIGDGYNPFGIFSCLDAVSFNGHVELDVSAGAPICIPLVPPVVVAGLQIELSAQGFVGNGGMQLFFQDLDGDGFADHVLKKAGDPTVYVKLNQASRANLLRSVLRPLGSTIALDYRRQGNRVDHSAPDHRIDMPNHQWVLASTTLDDGLGTSSYTTTFEYFDDAFYDRAERESYGYARVKATLPDGSTVDRRYHNQELYRRHRMTREEIADAAGNLFRVHTSEIELRPLGPGAAFPALVREETFLHEGQAAAGKSTFETYDYDALGNLIATFDAADEGADDDVAAAVDYRFDSSTHVTRPSHLAVRDGAGHLLRERQGSYNPKGDLVRLEQTLVGGRDPATGAAYTGSKNPVWTYSYDAFGNLDSSTDPTGFVSTTTYDPVVASYPIEVRDSFGYTSRFAWDLKHGKPTETVDQNGNAVGQAYDGFGRLIRVVGPYDTDTAPALAFDYGHAARPAWAVVHHKDVTRPDPIDSAVFIDGLGRLLQSKEDAELDLGSGTATKEGMRVSGKVEFDAKGRVAAQGQPVFDESPAHQFVAAPAKNPTRMTYDVLDRVREARYPHGAVIRLAYGFGTLDGVQRLLRTRTDPNGRATLFYGDVQGDVLGVEQSNTIRGARTKLVTRYDYDPLSQLTAVTDAAGNVTRLELDTVGRNVVVDNPDLGRTEYLYDPAGNLGARITANLAARNQQVRYLYTFNRLDRVDYPESPDVLFTYGGPGASDNRAGRIATVVNESGVEERFYDKLGDVVRTVETAAALNGNSPKGPYTTSFRFDSFGRLLAVTYPDGEELTYGYDAGGMVKSAAGVLAGVRFDYLRHQGYDEFGSRVRIVYGNGVETRYAFDPRSRDLAQLQTFESGGREIQDLRYQYDLTSTLQAIQNDVPIPSPPLYGGPTTQTFRYDDLYQLIAAEGSYRSPPNKQATYNLSLAYDETGNTIAKNQLHQSGPVGKLKPEKKTSFDWAYTYGGPQPHAPSRIGDRTFRYDANGNQIGWETDKNGTRRTLTWDEENRLKSVADNGQTTRFLYDAGGMRTNKSGQHGETIYVNRWFSVRNGAIVSKHVFADEVRLSTKVSPNPNPPSEKVYFYQDDHLGSTHFVTDERGTAWQHLEYFPSGEVWVDERSETQRTPYAFSGKELDEETGLSYFGFRYYEPRQGQWISADPILDGMLDTGRLVGGTLTSRPFRLPGHIFGYVGNNPVNLLDADGLITDEQREFIRGLSGGVGLLADYDKASGAFKAGYEYQIEVTHGLRGHNIHSVENRYNGFNRADIRFADGDLGEVKNTQNWGDAWRQFANELEGYAGSGRNVHFYMKHALPAEIKAMIEHFAPADNTWRLYENGGPASIIQRIRQEDDPREFANPSSWLSFEHDLAVSREIEAEERQAVAQSRKRKRSNDSPPAHAE